MTLDLERFEELPTNLLKNFNAALVQLIPSLYKHRCSIGVEGGFLQRLEEGTWLGHVIEHIALELQTLAGIECGFGRTFGTSTYGVYEVIYAYETEEAGLYAGRAAFNLVQALASGQEYSHLAEDLSTLKRLYNSEQFGPSTQALVSEAERRGIPYTRVGDSSLIILGHGCKQKKIWASVSPHTSSIGVEIASDKELTKSILDKNFIPVPHGKTVYTLEELDTVLSNLNFPVVIKPLNGNHGRGVLTNIKTREKAILGFELAKKISDKILVEEFIAGDDYRFLVVNYKVVAVAKRTPAMVIGTGIHSIQELIHKINADPKRGLGHENVLTEIEIDEETLSLLREQNLTLDSILPLNKILYLKGIANLSSGGTATDVTDLVHKSNIRLAEKVAKLIDLDLCGIDIIAGNISMPIRNDNGAVIEVNAGPGLRMHLQPSEGKPRNVAEPILDMLYPAGTSATIPIIAVTGTNGKTTVVRLLAKIAQKAQYQVGFCTSEGIYHNNRLIYAGDCSGPQSTKAVLSDPDINFAVLECARGGILREGLGFDECDISIITNISQDHLGLNEIHTIEDLAQVKSVVARSTKKTGYSILNAENELVYGMRNDLSCSIALFALTENSRIREHCQLGGLACYINNDFIVVQKGADKHPVAQLSHIPISFKGTASCMVKNILPAVLAAFISNISLTSIETTLYEFLPNPDTLPGRMNYFHFGNCHLMLDYAHNEDAFIELNHYLSKIPKKRKVGIIAAAGDRRDIDIQNIGFQAAKIFDEIIIRHDKDSRGNTNEQITVALMEGINRANTQAKVEVISDEFTAVNHALEHATQETFIFYTPEKVFNALDFLKNQHEKHANNQLINESTLL
jgi:cyanophycin synthetase